jgi:signal transduction histidine kinase
VTIDRTVFTQILLNLATNGAAAMAGRGELKIWLNEAAHASGDGVARQTRAACLRVIDTGCGMTKATLDRAFEPFFTTKPVGQGTGLGLPVVYGLVREMGGTIGLDSEPGAGTTVTIVIPGHHGGADNGSDIGD